MVLGLEFLIQLQTDPFVLLKPIQSKTPNPTKPLITPWVQKNYQPTQTTPKPTPANPIHLLLIKRTYLHFDLVKPFLPHIFVYPADHNHTSLNPYLFQLHAKPYPPSPLTGVNSTHTFSKKLSRDTTPCHKSTSNLGAKS